MGFELHASSYLRQTVQTSGAIMSRERERAQDSKRDEKERDFFVSKLVGTEFVYTNSVCRNRDSQIDKFAVLS